MKDVLILVQDLVEVMQIVKLFYTTQFVLVLLVMKGIHLLNVVFFLLHVRYSFNSYFHIIFARFLKLLFKIETERAPPATPCTPSPCGPNAECRERNGAGACFCNSGYEGNPYDDTKGCRRECELNSDCSDQLSCVRFKCVDSCIGTCGTYAYCEVKNHVPDCRCPEGFTGDPFFQCREIPVTR